MTNRGQNQGIHILEDFVCEAIPIVPPTNTVSEGRSEGMFVIEEVVSDAGPVAKPTEKQSERSGRSAGISEATSPIPDEPGA